MRWVFERDNDTISLQRTRDAEAYVLTVNAPADIPSHHRFPDIFSLTVAQVHIECALLEDGWVLCDVVPSGSHDASGMPLTGVITS